MNPRVYEKYGPFPHPCNPLVFFIVARFPGPEVYQAGPMPASRIGFYPEKA
jgi:hypothetical protein